MPPKRETPLENVTSRNSTAETWELRIFFILILIFAQQFYPHPKARGDTSLVYSVNLHMTMNLFSSLLCAAAALRLPKLLKDEHGGIMREFSEDDKFRFEGRVH